MSAGGTAYRLVAPQRGELVPVDEPIAGVGEVVLRILNCGVCASELPVWSAPRVDSPLRLGHEPVGEVVSVGPGATFRPGDLVGGRVEGAYASPILAAEEDLVRIPDDVDPATALPEPVGCVVEAYRRTPLRPGASVVVIGTGFMGLVMVQLLATSPASRFVVVDPRADARAAALANGAEEATTPSEVDGEFDVVVEASGTQSGLDLATRLAGEHGALCILGYHQADRSVDMEAWNRKALEVVNGHVRDRRLLREATAAGLRLQAHGRLDIARLVTHRFRFDAVDTALQALRDKPAGFIKGVVDIDD